MSSRIPGYNVVIRAFIPAPKGDFKAQAQAALLMEVMQSTRCVPEEFFKHARVLDVKGAYGSMAEEETASTAPNTSVGQTPVGVLVPDDGDGSANQSAEKPAQQRKPKAAS